MRPAPHRADPLRLSRRPGDDQGTGGRLEEAKCKIADCDRKLGQYRTALDEGGSAATIGVWIAETEAERTRHELAVRKVTGSRRMTEAEIKAIVDKLGSIAEVLGSADPLDKAEIFRHLGLRLT